MNSIKLLSCVVLPMFMLSGCGSEEEAPSDSPLGGIEDAVRDEGEDARDEIKDAEVVLKEETQDTSDAAQEAVEEGSSDLKEIVEEVIETVVEVAEENEDLLEKADIKVPEKPKFP